jgi:hypothetical protein
VRQWHDDQGIVTFVYKVEELRLVLWIYFWVSPFDFLVAPLVVTTTWENYYSLVGNQ